MKMYAIKNQARNCLIKGRRSGNHVHVFTHLVDEGPDLLFYDKDDADEFLVNHRDELPDCLVVPVLVVVTIIK